MLKSGNKCSGVCQNLFVKLFSNVLKILQNRIGDTPLHAAASRGHLEVVQLLLSNGADHTVRNSDGMLADSIANIPAVKSTIQSQRLIRKNSASYAPEDYCNEDDGDQSD